MLHRRDASGFGLIELILTIAIMGTALVFLIGSMTTATRTSGFLALRSQSESYARRLAELVRSPAVPVQCNATSQTQAYTDALNTALTNTGGPLSGFSFTVQDVAFTSTLSTSPTTMNPAPGLGWTRGACTPPVPALVWVKIEVTSNAAPTASATIAVLQRNPSAS